MSLNQLFKPKFTTGQTIKIVTPSGAMLDSCEVNIGQLTGRFRSLSAILCDGTDDAEPWHVINLVDGSGALLDHIAIQGAVSRDQAKRLCNKYLPQMQNGFIRNVVTTTDNALKTFLDGAVLPSNTPYFLENDAMLLDLQGSVQAVEWGEDNRLLSHGGHLSKVMYDMACCDAQDDLLAQVSPRDIVSMLVDETCVFGGMMDAMIIKYRQFDIVMQKVAEALKSYDHEDLFVKSVTPIEPFKRNNVVNVGTIFTMSDSQTITVLFNNPDTTPAKLTADDVLTSWKWMLNKRDVTAVLQPRAVEAKKYPVIAGRIIKLFAKNHDRFKRNQKIREKEELLLNELINQVEAKQTEVRFIDSEILKQQQEIDAETVRKQNQTEIGKAGLTAENAEEFHENLKNTLAQNEQNVQINNDEQNEAVKTGVVFKKEAEDIWRAIDYSVTDYQGHTANEFKNADVKGRFEPLIIKAEALLTRRFRDEHQKEMTELSIKNAKKTIARWEKAQEDVSQVESQQFQGKEYRYALLHRPVGVGNTPNEGFIRSEDAKGNTAVFARYGIAVYNRSLSDAEMEQYEIKYIPTDEELADAVVKVATALSEHKNASKFLENLNSGNGSSLELMITKTQKDLYPNMLFERPQQFLVDVSNSFLQIMNINAVAEDGSESQVENPIPGSGESTSETEQFLQSVIDGTADMSDQAFSDKLLAVADNLDPSLESLFEQASDAYADYAINLEV